MAMAIPIKMFEVDQCTFFHHLGLMKDESIVSVRAEAVIIHQKETQGAVHGENMIVHKMNANRMSSANFFIAKSMK